MNGKKVIQKFGSVQFYTNSVLVELRLVQALQVQKLLYILVSTSKHETLFIIPKPISIDAICPCKFCQQFLIYKSVTTPSLSYAHDQCRNPKKEKKIVL